MPAQIPLDLPHTASLSRDDLIVAPSNRLAVDAVDAWPDWRHSVLIVHGPAGSGKTHLLNAWTEMSGARRAGADTVEEAIAEPGFRVAVDDLDRTELSQRDLFALVNAARLGGGTLLATSRTQIANLAMDLPDLRSRLVAATHAELGAPDDMLLTGVLTKLFADRQLTVTPKNVSYLAERMERSLDAARRLVAAIDEESLAGKTRIGPRLLKRVLDREAGAICHREVASAAYQPPTTED